MASRPAARDGQANPATSPSARPLSITARPWPAVTGPRGRNWADSRPTTRPEPVAAAAPMNGRAHASRSPAANADAGPNVRWTWFDRTDICCLSPGTRRQARPDMGIGDRVTPGIARWEVPDRLEGPGRGSSVRRAQPANGG